METKFYVAEIKHPWLQMTRLAVEELKAPGFKTVWLVEQKPVTKNRRTEMRDVSLIPGYLFIGCDGSDEAWRTVYACRGIHRVLHSAGRPVALRDGSVEQLEARFKAGEFKDKPPIRLREGDRVIVAAGVFIGHATTVTKAEDERILVKLTLFGIEHEVPMRDDMLRRAVA